MYIAISNYKVRVFKNTGNLKFEIQTEIIRYFGSLIDTGILPSLVFFCCKPLTMAPAAPVTI